MQINRISNPVSFQAQLGMCSGAKELIIDGTAQEKRQKAKNQHLEHKAYLTKIKALGSDEDRITIMQKTIVHKPSTEKEGIYNKNDYIAVDSTPEKGYFDVIVNGKTILINGESTLWMLKKTLHYATQILSGKEIKEDPDWARQKHNESDEINKTKKEAEDFLNIILNN